MNKNMYKEWGNDSKVENHKNIILGKYNYKFFSKNFEEFSLFTQLYTNVVQFLYIPLHNHKYLLIYKEDWVQLIAFFLRAYSGWLR